MKQFEEALIQKVPSNKEAEGYQYSCLPFLIVVVVHMFFLSIDILVSLYMWKLLIELILVKSEKWKIPCKCRSVHIIKTKYLSKSHFNFRFLIEITIESPKIVFSDWNTKPGRTTRLSP
jgi:hypothetical protein